MTTPSFSPTGARVCHRCRSTSGTGASDPVNHICQLANSLYVARVATPSDIVDNYQNYVGGFTIPSFFVEAGFTNFPCPLEMIVTNSGNFIKIGHGCAPSGPFYVYMQRDGSLSMTYYRVNGSRINSRNLSSISSLAVHFNGPTSNGVPPSTGFGGFAGNTTVPTIP